VEIFSFESTIWRCTSRWLALGMRASLTWGGLTTTQQALRLGNYRLSAASTAIIPIIGKLGDIYVRKWFVVGGIVVFLARPRAKRRSPRARRRALS
jgi:hypothetical protein